MIYIEVFGSLIGLLLMGISFSWFLNGTWGLNIVIAAALNVWLRLHTPYGQESLLASAAFYYMLFSSVLILGMLFWSKGGLFEVDEKELAKIRQRIKEIQVTNRVKEADLREIRTDLIRLVQPTDRAGRYYVKRVIGISKIASATGRQMAALNELSDLVNHVNQKTIRLFGVTETE